MRFAWLAGVATAALMRCTSFSREQPPITNPPPPGISYRFTDDLAEPQRKAVDYCLRYGRTAKLSEVEPAGNEKVANFECD